MTFQSNRQTQTFVQDTEDHNVNYNVSGQLTKDLRGRFAVSNERMKGAPGFPTIEPDSTSRDNPALFQGERQYTNNFTDSYAAVFDWVTTPRLYVNLTTGYFTYGARGKGPVGTNLRHTFNGSNFQFADVPASLQNVSGYADDISSSIIVKDDYGRFTFNSDATYYTNWKGQHTLKAGVQYERISNDVNRGQQFPTIQLNWDAVRGTLDGRNVRGKYGYYTVTRGTVTLGDFSVSNTGLFIQDAWTLNNRVTLNLGIRTEVEDVPSYKPQNPGIHFSFADKISPRVGFAWDLKGDSTWKAYGSWGVFHDLMKLSMSRILFGADRWVDYFYTLDTADWPSIQCGYPPTGGPSCPGTFIEQADFRHEANDVNSSLIDPGIKPMRSQEFTLGMDHELNQHDLDRRAVFAQVAEPRDRSVRRAAARRRRDLPDLEPGLRVGSVAVDRPVHLARPRLPELSRPAGGEARLRRRRVPAAEALLGQLGADHQLLVQPALRQLLRPGEFRRERQRLGENRSELQPRIRPVDGIVRRAGARRVRPAADRSPAGVQGAGLVLVRASARPSAATTSCRAARRCRRR